MGPLTLVEVVVIMTAGDEGGKWALPMPSSDTSTERFFASNCRYKVEYCNPHHYNYPVAEAATSASLWLLSPPYHPFRSLGTSISTQERTITIHKTCRGPAMLFSHMLNGSVAIDLLPPPITTDPLPYGSALKVARCSSIPWIVPNHIDAGAGLTCHLVAWEERREGLKGGGNEKGKAPVVRWCQGLQLRSNILISCSTICQPEKRLHGNIADRSGKKPPSRAFLFLAGKKTNGRIKTSVNARVEAVAMVLGSAVWSGKGAWWCGFGGTSDHGWFEKGVGGWKGGNWLKAW